MAKPNPISNPNHHLGRLKPSRDRPRALTLTSATMACPSRQPTPALLRPRSRWGRSVGVRRPVLQNAKTPRRAASWANRGVGRGLFGGELASLRLLEAAVFALRVDLAQNRAIKRGRWRLAMGAGPELRLRHRVDHLLAIHRRAGVGQDLGGSVEGAHLLRLGLLLTLLVPLRLGRRFRAWRLRGLSWLRRRGRALDVGGVRCCFQRGRRRFRCGGRSTPNMIVWSLLCGSISIFPSNVVQDSCRGPQSGICFPAGASAERLWSAYGFAGCVRSP
jgi:hypothetical protein